MGSSGVMAALARAPLRRSILRQGSVLTSALPMSDAVQLVVVTGSDLMLWLAMAVGRLSVSSALVLHFGLVIGSAVLIMRRATPGDWSLSVVGILCLLLVGPAGSLGTVAMMQIVKRAKGDSDRLAAWYERLSGGIEIDGPSQLHERLAAGRAPRLVASDIRQFTNVLRQGNDREREIVLGLIGLRYSRDCRKALDYALTSPQASVRVQAAAVFVKLRARYKGLLKKALSLHGTADLGQEQALEAVRGLLQALESGFLDSSEVRTARSVAQELFTTLDLKNQSGLADRELESLACRPSAVEDFHQSGCSNEAAVERLRTSQMRQLAGAIVRDPDLEAVGGSAPPYSRQM